MNSQRMVNLLNELQSKKIDIQEFLKKCAYWALEDEPFSELKLLLLPTPPDTEAYLEYQNLSVLQKRKLDIDFFLHNPEIIEYIRQRNRIIRINKENLRWLKEIRSYIPEDDFENHQKINSRIMEFESWFDTHSEEIEEIKRIFNAKEVEND